MRTVRIAKEDGTITMLHDDEVKFEGLDKGITRLTDVQFDRFTSGERLDCHGNQSGRCG